MIPQGIHNFNVLSPSEIVNIDLKRLPAAYIINSKPGIGEHWLGIYILRRGGQTVAFAIDSLGEDFDHYHIPIPVPIVSQLTRTIQSDTSTNCGLFVLYILYKLSQGLSLKAATRVFGSNLNTNDEIVENFIKRAHLNSEKTGGQTCCSRKVAKLLANQNFRNK